MGRLRERRKAAPQQRVAENPTQPPGWAVDKDTDNSDEVAKQLLETERKKREDTARQIDEDNRAPANDQNPAQPGGYEYKAASRRTARVFTAAASPQEGDRVLIRGEGEQHVGHIVALSSDVPDGFAVEWSDGEVTLEPTSAYEVVGPRPFDQAQAV